MHIVIYEIKKALKSQKFILVVYKFTEWHDLNEVLKVPKIFYLFGKIHNILYEVLIVSKVLRFEQDF